MKIVILLAIALLFGCGDQDDTVTFPTIDGTQIGDNIGPAPIPSNVRARMTASPPMALPACRSACERSGGVMFRFGPVDSRQGWECLCSWEN